MAIGGKNTLQGYKQTSLPRSSFSPFGNKITSCDGHIFIKKDNEYYKLMVISSATRGDRFVLIITKEPITDLTCINESDEYIMTYVTRRLPSRKQIDSFRESLSR